MLELPEVIYSTRRKIEELHGKREVNQLLIKLQKSVEKAFNSFTWFVSEVNTPVMSHEDADDLWGFRKEIADIRSMVTESKNIISEVVYTDVNNSSKWPYTISYLDKQRGLRFLDCTDAICESLVKCYDSIE